MSMCVLHLLTPKKKTKTFDCKQWKSFRSDSSHILWKVVLHILLFCAMWVAVQFVIFTSCCSSCKLVAITQHTMAANEEVHYHVTSDSRTTSRIRMHSNMRILVRAHSCYTNTLANQNIHKKKDEGVQKCSMQALVTRKLLFKCSAQSEWARAWRMSSTLDLCPKK